MKNTISVINLIFTVLLSNHKVLTSFCGGSIKLDGELCSHISSPKYPSRDQMDCEWTVTAPTDKTITAICSLELAESEDCEEDSLIFSKVKGTRSSVKKLCGVGDYKIVSRQNKLLIDYSGYGRFSCNLMVTGQKSCSFVERNAPTPLIVSGNETFPHEFPFLVALIDDSGGQFCGGSIITTKHCLTAAHCTYSQIKNRRPFTILAGAHSLDEEIAQQEHHEVAGVFIHSQYDPESIQNDISIVELKVRFRLSEAIYPVCLPSSFTFSTPGNTLTVVGWGKISQTGPPTVIPQKVNLLQISSEHCVEKYPSIDPEMQGQICTLSPGKGACMGDSGGPCFKSTGEKNTLVQVGIVSFGRTCGSAFDPTVYTAVGTYVSWIKSKIGGANLCVKAGRSGYRQ